MPQEQESRELESRIETIHGDIRSMQELDNWQSSAQITKDRINNTNLRRKRFYTNNHALNSVEEEGGERDAFLYFGSNDDSIFRAETIDEAFKQLRDSNTGNYYRPSEEDCRKAKESSLRLRVSDLELKFDSESDSFGYIEIDTSDLKGENFKTDAQRKFAEAVYGSMAQDENGESDYSRAMKMLNNDGKGINITRIYTLRKETVLEDAKEGDIARACGLIIFNGNSYFYANGCYGNFDGLRGVLKSGEAGAQENKVDAIKVNPFADAYQLLTHPDNRQNVLSEMTPENATALSGLITDYLSLQAKKQ